MTRASLLRILDHVDGISDNEIRELEQLAAAFPYCQTAHVLLAKTAHDRGSMLAGQRLRRAATYATDRELLRHLLERPAAPAVPPVTPPAEPLSANSPHPTAVTATSTARPSLPTPAEPDLFAVEFVPAVVLADETPPAAAPGSQPEALAIPQQAPVVEAPAPAPLPDPLEPGTRPVVAEPSGPKAPVATQPLEAEDRIQAALPLPGPAATEPEQVLLPIAASAETGVIATISNEATEEVASEQADIPPVAPPIRPPSDVGTSRFEFGLGESRLPEPTGYRLPGLEGEDEESTAAAEEALTAFSPAVPAPITAPFQADAEVGYALGGGSRLGYDLQARASDGFTLDLPLEAFFEPDALLLAHARAHQPPRKASSLDLINRFLKTQPRIRAGAVGVPPPATEQADLSVRSGAPAPALASESLAKIMVRQGKTAKAIEIYERLMAKQPEKMAYFAEQIQQLQQAPE